MDLPLQKSLRRQIKAARPGTWQFSVELCEGGGPGILLNLIKTDCCCGRLVNEKGRESAVKQFIMFFIREKTLTSVTLKSDMRCWTLIVSRNTIEAGGLFASEFQTKKAQASPGNGSSALRAVWINSCKCMYAQRYAEKVAFRFLWNMPDKCSECGYRCACICWKQNKMFTFQVTFLMLPACLSTIFLSFSSGNFTKI